MTRWLAKSLKRKLILLLLPAILLPLLLTGALLYRMAANAAEEKAKGAGMNTLRQIAGKLEFVVQDLENMSLFLIGQRDIQLYLDNGEEDISRYTLNVGFLTNLAFSKKYIADITVEPASGIPPLTTTTKRSTGLPEVLLRHEETYRQSVRWWSPLYENRTPEGTKRVFSLVRPIRSFNDFRTLGTLSIAVDEAEIRTYLTGSGWEAEGRVLMLDEKGQVLSAADPAWPGRPLAELYPGIGQLAGSSGIAHYGEGEGRQTVLYHTLPGIGWKLVGFLPTRIYTAQSGYILAVTAGAVLLGLLLAAGLVLVFTDRVTRPLTRLAHNLKGLNPDEPMPLYEVKSSDEVGLLLHSYNKLSDRIQRLKEQVQQEEARKKEADLQALQAQIHPHFLYNTLSSIHWTALMNKDRQTSEMVGALSDFLRFSLNGGEEYCPLQQEVEHARNYAYIQAIRFPGQFEIEFYIDPSLSPQPVLKLLLQPLIENALVHGIQKLGRCGSIYIHVRRQGDSAVFAVEDTGAGIPEERLRELRSELTGGEAGKAAVPAPAALKHTKKTSGYGLRNVHQRLLLHYGRGAGLGIDSAPQQGTRITFTIPIEEATA
ncbi:integral membrane sensor signal transduction histidine kinase [Paenibacillus mucilaginosus 3016]|uniref:histidine kinase n=2 Tax=Paenibacillus mucilaginosus TaxID=61624 RepID=H6NKM6_9BACL|nr:sensor histidine kinase [Paenibacillus mucilaginosus]AFC33163.1 integral membrane sensor signal transduction histidine kinase [Paenibacillus mucilaginosus 3016]AFH65476.1 histidine kinase [Paenibacillus mucilaginosus K02]WFA21592.1 sensor histidine kinase [Paenibacillus mucilaginosus]